ncbi:B12-binding domain-containing radical SAM protein [Amycolatopsis rhizosphaerae]|uniref:B12-binding domain-containing radical SAM protein n=1 Tax=Amycolatopsis rhizosphaerae TaxID=2053003 RepID=A0A558DKB9_9PSEU|nr:radical SAM protein [Amycolatopsis rhizosphaerae]TVT61465.1 B12-binding domain-containing radical SAM protein [Amycolatopsis rhizosphaerae]
MTLRDVSVLLLYPPNQNLPGTVCKPNGSLAYPHLGGALRHHGVPVRVFDACVGDGPDDLDDIFANPSMLSSGLLRTGVGDERILEVVAEHDIIGITSIFTDQESMVLHCARLIKAAYPGKILVSGGVNARSRLPKLFEAGFDVVCLSEAEHTLVEIVEAARRSARPSFSHIHGVAFHDADRIRLNPARSQDIVQDLDTLPMPAWDLLPNQRYWTLARPHSGLFEPGAELRYGTMMTSLGCPFHCAYCHIAGEEEGSLSGPIGSFRVKSDERVLAEIETLKGLGVTDVFIEDDSLLGQKKRGLRLLEKIQGAGVTVCDLNGINIIHLLKRWKPDHEVLEALAMAGFTQLNMPFETGNLRIMRKYASNKLNVEKADLRGLITAMKEYGFKLYGNYMMGYPDETLEEIETTIALAREHVSHGLDAANFFLVVPMPGTPLFDMAIAGGHLSPDFDPDRMNIYHATMTNTVVPGKVLEELRARAWDEVNSAKWKTAKKAWAATVV